VVSFKTVRVLPNEGEAVGKFENEKLVYLKALV
jgi:hypothetical protein